MPVSSKSIGTLQLTWKLPRHWSYALSMLTWNLREAAITAQVMHNRLSAGAIIQGWGSRNTRPVISTKILQLCSFPTVLLLNTCIFMPSWGLPGKYSSLLSLPLHPTGRVCNVLYGATSGNMGLSPHHHSQEIGNPGYPFLEHCFNVIGLSLKMPSAQLSDSLKKTGVQPTWAAVWKGKIFLTWNKNQTYRQGEKASFWSL